MASSQNQYADFAYEIKYILNFEKEVIQLKVNNNI